MSVAIIDTRNPSGTRARYHRAPLAGLGRELAPAETAPVASYFSTRALAGVRDFSTQSCTHALGCDGCAMAGVCRHGMGAIAMPPVMGPTGMPYAIPEYRIALPWLAASPVTAPIASATAAPTTAPFTPPPTTAQQTTPTPTTAAVTTPPAGVAISSGGPAAATAQPGTPVPVSTPTSQSYTDTSGTIWTFSPSAGWQPTGQIAAPAAAASGGAAGATTPGTVVNVQAGSSMWESLTSWLQESSVISGVPNFWLVAGVGLAGMFLYGGGGRRR